MKKNILFLVRLCFLCGCIRTISSEIESQVLSYMDANYEKPEYKVNGILYAGLEQDYDQMNAHCTKEGLEGDFTVRRWEKDGEVWYEDTYQGLLLRPEIEDMVKEYSVWKDCKIYSDTGFLWLKPQQGLTLEQAIKNGEDIRSDIWVLVPENAYDSKRTFEADALKFKKKWKGNIRAYFSIYYIKQEAWEKADRENCYDLAGDNCIEMIYIA